MPSDATPQPDERIERDRAILKAIRAQPEEREQIGRELFYSHFPDIERTTRSRLYDCGLSDDAELLEYLIKEIYAAEALPGAVEGYDPVEGPLDNWLLRRVGFKVSDWLKQRSRTPQEFLTSRQDDWSSHAPNDTDPPDVEAVLRQLMPLERASIALLLIVVRDLNALDLDAITIASGRTADEIHALVAAVRDSHEMEQRLGEREEELIRELARCNGLLRWFASRAGRFRRLLREQARVTDAVIEEIEHRAARVLQSQQQIRERYSVSDNASELERAIARLMREFELAHHNAARMRRRLAILTDESRRLPPVPLVAHGWIAEVLGTGPSHVASAIHRARKRLKDANCFEKH